MGIVFPAAVKSERTIWPISKDSIFANRPFPGVSFLESSALSGLMKIGRSIPRRLQQLLAYVSV